MKNAKLAPLLLFTVLVLMLTSGCTSFQKGEGLILSKQYKEAIKVYSEYMDTHPGSTTVRARLAYAYLMDGQDDNAITNYEQVLKENPKDMDSVLYLGMAYMHKGEIGKANAILAGYKNKNNPQVEAEVAKQMTILSIASSHKVAKDALANEQKLGPASVKPGSVAVLYFQDESPNKSLTAIQKAMAAMIISDLAQVKSLSVLERVRIQALFDEMRLGQAGITEQSSAPQIGKLLGAESVVTGAMLTPPDMLKVNASLASTASQAMKAGFSTESRMDQFFTLEKELVYNTIKSLGVNLTPAEEEAIKPFHTKSLKAVIYYGSGLDALDAGKWDEALNFFTMALKEDPYFKMAQSGKSSTPSSSTPSIHELSTMSLNAVTQAVTTSISQSATAGTPSSSTTGGGVGGSGGSGGSSGGSGGSSGGSSGGHG